MFQSCGKNSTLMLFSPGFSLSLSFCLSLLFVQLCLFSRYALRAYSDTASLCGEGCARSIECDLSELLPTEFAKCVASLSKSDWAGTLALVGSLVGLAFVVMTVLVVWRRRRVMQQTRSMAEQLTGSDFLLDEFDEGDAFVSDSMSTEASE